MEYKPIESSKPIQSDHVEDMAILKAIRFGTMSADEIAQKLKLENSPALLERLGPGGKLCTDGLLMFNERIGYMLTTKGREELAKLQGAANGHLNGVASYG